MHSWKLLLTLGLLLAVLCSVVIRAPRHRIAAAELRRLVLAAILLYAVGAGATWARRELLAGVVFASGILVCSLAVWLSRGSDFDDGSDWPGGGGPPEDEQPPPGPGGFPGIDWDEFERERAAWAENVRPLSA